MTEISEKNNGSLRCSFRKGREHSDKVRDEEE